MWVHNLAQFQFWQAIASLPLLEKEVYWTWVERGETKQKQGIKLGEGDALEESPSRFWEYKVYDEIQVISRLILTWSRLRNKK